MTGAKIIFIYNANKGLFSGLMDSAHKLISPDTYACDLCSITHGWMGAKKEWRDFIASLDHSLVFYHKNDRPKSMQDFKLPVILIEKDDSLKELVTADEMASMRGIADLTERINQSIFA